MQIGEPRRGDTKKKVSPTPGLFTTFYFPTPGFTRGHNSMAPFGPFGDYNSNYDKNGIKVFFITLFLCWLDSQIRRSLPRPPRRTGGFKKDLHLKKIRNT
jgi:hypothetical protein